MPSSRRPRHHRKRTSADSTRTPPPLGEVAAQRPEGVPSTTLWLRQLTPDPLSAAILTIFALILAILYFGHQAVPNSDYTAFVDTARSFLRFLTHGLDPDQIGSFKRLPGFGLLVLAFGTVMPGPHPDLTAGWFVNAAAYVATAPLLFYLALPLLGRYAKFFTLIALLNPYALQLLGDPIIETTLIFAFVLGIFLIFRRSRLRYPVIAALTLLRYEAAALILVAFVLDLLDAPNWPRRACALLYAALASLPLALWMLGTLLAAADKPTGLQGTYLGHFRSGDYVFVAFSRYLWGATLAPLLGHFSRVQIPSGAAAEIFLPYELPTQVALVLLLVAAAAFAILRRDRFILALFLLVLPYFLVHSLRYGTRVRYTVPIAWAVLLLAAVGLRGLWYLLNRLKPVPRPLAILAQALLLTAATAWLLALVGHLPQSRPFSPTSYPTIFIALATLALLLTTPLILSAIPRPSSPRSPSSSSVPRASSPRSSFSSVPRASSPRSSSSSSSSPKPPASSLQPPAFFPLITAAVLTALFLVSNHFTLARTLGRGDRDIEFKKLADWYRDNHQPGDKLVTSLPTVVALYAPRLEDSLIQTAHIPGDNLEEFTNNARERNITLIAWDSRIGFARGNSYYIAWGIERLPPLAQGRNLGPYQHLTTITTDNPRRFIHLYRLTAQQ